MAQPQHDPEDRTTNQCTYTLLAAREFLIASVVTTAAAFVVLTDLAIQPVPVSIDILLAAAVVTAWGLYANQRSEERRDVGLDRIEARLDRLEARLDERLTRAGEAEAFVDGLMRREDGRVLRSV